LLDTRVLTRALLDIEYLQRRYVFAISSKYNEVYFSAASIWELAVNAEAAGWAKGYEPEEIAQGALDAGFVELPITSDAAAKMRTLPPIHDNVFDRILIAQAISESTHLLTNNPVLGHYSDLVDVVESLTRPRFKRYGASARTAR
jgi:PIN domain nuclease of toxin-antitoxin system